MRVSEAMASSPPVSVTEIDLKAPPMYLVVLHRLARLGKADTYTTSRRYVQFYMDNREPLCSKWLPLQDADRVTIIYRDPVERVL